MNLVLEDYDSYLRMNTTLQHIKHFYVYFFLGFIVCLFRRELVWLATEDKIETTPHCTFHGIVEGF